MSDILKTVLLLALPASGKSEVRRYLALLPEEDCQNDFHMGPTVQLDDFPYVHMMRVIDNALTEQDADRIFFKGADRPFIDTKDWGTLIQLVNEDYEDLVAKRVHKPSSAAHLLFDRFDAASTKVGLSARIGSLDSGLRNAIADIAEKEAAQLLEDKHKNYPDTLNGKTLVIEFARGGPDGSDMPLPSPLGYRYSLSQLSEEILQDAGILYVWVTPEESRRKNEARTDPNDPGSILHHGVPLEVMMNDYGCDDMDWLEANSPNPGHIAVEAHGKTFSLAIGRFDNRVDKSSFLRNDPDDWAPEEVKAIHNGLKEALDKIKGA